MEQYTHGHGNRRRVGLRHGKDACTGERLIESSTFMIMKDTQATVGLAHSIYHSHSSLINSLKPPENKMYLLGKETKGQRNRFSFSHFFHMEAIHNEHTGFDIISMDDFIKREALAGRFRDEDGKIIQPPDHETGRTNFDGEPETVFKYLRQVALVASWSPDHCLAVFPSSTGQSDMQLLEELDGAIHQSSLPT